MKHFFTMAAALLAGWFLSGCVTFKDGVRFDRQLTLSKEQAIVLVGIDSEIPLGRIRQNCAWPCTASLYELGRRKDILAFTVDVGTAFKLDAISTAEFRTRWATLNGPEMKIDRHGVYYYGMVRGNQYSVGLGQTVSPYFLLAAKRKYGSRFDHLETVNFTWPSPADDRRIRFGYPISTTTQVALTSSGGGKRMNLAVVSPTIPPFDANCRDTGPLSLPEFLPQEEYIRRAFNAELDAAQRYGDDAGSMVLKGALTDLAFSTQLGSAHWKIGLRVEMPDGRAVTANVNERFSSAFSGNSACPYAEDAFPDVVQKLIESVMTTPEFQAILSAPVPTR